MAAHCGRRLRKGAATTAVAAAAVAALSASQAPGATGDDHGRQATAGASAPVPDPTGDDATVPRDAPKRTISAVRLPEPAPEVIAAPDVPEPARGALLVEGGNSQPLQRAALPALCGMGGVFCFFFHSCLRSMDGRFRHIFL